MHLPYCSNSRCGSSVVGLSGVGLSELGLSGLGLSGVSLEISVSYLDTATVGVRLHFLSLSLQYLRSIRLMFLLVVKRFVFMWVKMFGFSRNFGAFRVRIRRYQFVEGVGSN